MNLDYHLAEGVDHIVVTDNGSVDGTCEVVEEYVRRAPVQLLREPPSDFSQHRWVTRMAQLTYTGYGADWVINADADEFFVFRNGRLKDALKTMPPDIQRVLVDRHDFVATARQEGGEEVTPPRNMIYRTAYLDAPKVLRALLESIGFQ